MALLIDGYNLLHASGILGRGIGPGGLQRSRLALLNFLAESLPSRSLPGTTVVFDAAAAPPGLPDTLHHRGITVRFARHHESADALIEELVRMDSAPRRLTVVSSDHRLHRAARRRKAKAVDSDQWYAQLARQRSHAARSPARDLRKPETPQAEDEVEYWLSHFSDTDLNQQAADTQIFPPGYGEEMEDDRA
jgi:predicted RNA-binding protein with PIN domain